MKVAIVHYWLVGMRGGERVIEALCEMFPDADLFTHVYNPEQVSATIRRHTVKTTFISRLPRARGLYQAYLPLMPLALEQLDLREYDLVISSESGPAKGVMTRADACHICYCHTPMRYLWDMYPEYLHDARRALRPIWRLLASSLRRSDLASAARVDYFVANSHNVARRIWRCYQRDAEVVYPPVNTALFKPVEQTGNGDYLYVGQLIGYKRVDLAIEAFNRMGKSLVIIGDGGQRGELTRLAGPTIRFRGRVDDTALREAYVNCRALVFPGEEDFGIVPLEAMACGRPIVAFGRGGALETVVAGETGLFFNEPTVESLIDAVKRFERVEHIFDPVEIAAHAETFSTDRFKKEMQAVIDKAVACSAARWTIAPSRRTQPMTAEPAAL